MQLTLTTLGAFAHDGRSPAVHHCGLRVLVEYYVLRHISGEFVQVWGMSVIRSSLLDDYLLVDVLTIVGHGQRIATLREVGQVKNSG